MVAVKIGEHKSFNIEYCARLPFHTFHLHDFCRYPAELKGFKKTKN